MEPRHYLRDLKRAARCLISRLAWNLCVSIPMIFMENRSPGCYRGRHCLRLRILANARLAIDHFIYSTGVRNVESVDMQGGLLNGGSGRASGVYGCITRTKQKSCIPRNVGVSFRSTARKDSLSIRAVTERHSSTAFQWRPRLKSGLCQCSSSASRLRPS